MSVDHDGVQVDSLLFMYSQENCEGYAVILFQEYNLQYVCVKGKFLQDCQSLLGMMPGEWVQYVSRGCRPSEEQSEETNECLVIYTTYPVVLWDVPSVMLVLGGIDAGLGRERGVVQFLDLYSLTALSNANMKMEQRNKSLYKLSGSYLEQKCPYFVQLQS